MRDEDLIYTYIEQDFELMGAWSALEGLRPWPGGMKAYQDTPVRSSQWIQILRMGEENALPHEYVEGRRICVVRHDVEIHYIRVS